MITFKFLLAVLGAFLLIESNVDGAPLLKTNCNWTTAPAASITHLPDFKLPYYDTNYNVSDQGILIHRRGHTGSDSKTTTTEERINRNPVAFLQALAKKFRDSHHWVKKSSGWEWVQRQGSRIGDILRQAWNWFGRVVLGRQQEDGSATPQTDVIDSAPLDSGPFFTRENDPGFDVTRKTFDKTNTAIVQPAVPTNEKNIGQGQTEAKVEPALLEDNMNPGNAIAILKPQVPTTEVKLDKGKGKAVAEPITPTTPTLRLDKGKGKAIAEPQPITPKKEETGILTPPVTKEEFLKLEIEGEPGYGNIPGPSNYREKAWERFSAHFRPQHAEPAPATSEHDTVASPEVELDTKSAPAAKPVRKQPDTAGNPIVGKEPLKDERKVRPPPVPPKVPLDVEQKVESPAVPAAKEPLAGDQKTTPPATPASGESVPDTAAPPAEQKPNSETTPSDVSPAAKAKAKPQAKVPEKPKSWFKAKPKPVVYFGPRNRRKNVTPPEKNMGLADWPEKHNCRKCKSGDPGPKPPVNRKNPADDPLYNHDQSWAEYIMTLGQGYEVQGPQQYNPEAHYYKAYKVRAEKDIPVLYPISFRLDHINMIRAQRKREKEQAALAEATGKGQAATEGTAQEPEQAGLRSAPAGSAPAGNAPAGNAPAGSASAGSTPAGASSPAGTPAGSAPGNSAPAAASR